MKKNNGYTLIEMIIVIAIIAILSAASFATVGIIHKAKAMAAASTLDNQIGALLVKTKALSEAKGQRLCMQIRKNSSDVTYADGSIASANSYSLILGYHDGANFIEKEANTALATLPNIISVKQTEKKDSVNSSFNGYNEDTNMFIEFNKSNGSVRYGAGKYDIIFKGRIIATVELDSSTGNHCVK